MRVLIIADDLTGALDSAVTLTGTGLGCVVARRPGDIPAALARRPGVLAVSTASREGSAAAARVAVEAVVAAVAEELGGLPGILVKKVDSRLKGHVREEVAAFAAAARRTRALVAPAIPALGRVVAGGAVVGAGVASPIDVGAAVAGIDLDLAVPDTRDDADLDRALGMALAGPPVLLVGAAGLTAAVARRLGASGPALVRRLPGPLTLAIGSRDPVTMAQLAHLAREGTTVALAPDGVVPPASGTGPVDVLRLVPAEGRPLDPVAAGDRFAAGVAARVAGGAVGTLLACGGETADAILGALGVGVLDLDGEILPGVPVSTMLVGGRAVPLVTKSGGFGDPRALAVVAAAAAPTSSEGRR